MGGCRLFVISFGYDLQDEHVISTLCSRGKDEQVYNSLCSRGKKIDSFTDPLSRGINQFTRKRLISIYCRSLGDLKSIV